jgi:alpha-mannosidase
VNVKTGWSVDPFGHGPTVPYLLKKSEVTGGAVIQRLHFAWKEWFARTQNGDFFWRQNWDWSGHTDTLVHNMPFAIYSIRASCGPHPQVHTPSPIAISLEKSDTVFLRRPFTSEKRRND